MNVLKIDKVDKKKTWRAHRVLIKRISEEEIYFSIIHPPKTLAKEDKLFLGYINPASRFEQVDPGGKVGQVNIEIIVESSYPHFSFV